MSSISAELFENLSRLVDGLLTWPSSQGGEGLIDPTNEIDTIDISYDFNHHHGAFRHLAVDWVIEGDSNRLEVDKQAGKHQPQLGHLNIDSSLGFLLFVDTNPTEPYALDFSHNLNKLA